MLWSREIVIIATHRLHEAVQILLVCLLFRFLETKSRKVRYLYFCDLAFWVWDFGTELFVCDLRDGFVRVLMEKAVYSLLVLG